MGTCIPAKIRRFVSGPNVDSARNFILPKRLLDTQSGQNASRLHMLWLGGRCDRSRWFVATTLHKQLMVTTQLPHSYRTVTAQLPHSYHTVTTR